MASPRRLVAQILQEAREGRALRDRLEHRFGDLRGVDLRGVRL